MLWQAISFQIDGGGSSETAVATFNGIAILTPRLIQLDFLKCLQVERLATGFGPIYQMF